MSPACNRFSRAEGIFLLSKHTLSKITCFLASVKKICTKTWNRAKIKLKSDISVWRMSRERGDGKNLVFHTECFLLYFVLMFLRIFSLKSYTHLHLNKFRHVGQLSGWHLPNLKDLCSSPPKPQSQSRKINENFRPDPNPVLIPEKKRKKNAISLRRNKRTDSSFFPPLGFSLFKWCSNH